LSASPSLHRCTALRAASRTTAVSAEAAALHHVRVHAIAIASAFVSAFVLDAALTRCNDGRLGDALKTSTPPVSTRTYCCASTVTHWAFARFPLPQINDTVRRQRVALQTGIQLLPQILPSIYQSSPQHKSPWCTSLSSNRNLTTC